MRRLKAVLLRVEQSYLLFRGIRRLRSHLLHNDVSFQAITEIWLGWGNTGYSAPPELLYELALHAQRMHGGIVLECGCGVSTLVLGLVAERTRSRVISLENDSSWRDALQRRLGRLLREQVELRIANLTEIGDFEWYNPQVLPALETVGLLLCDGPPGATRGGRIGALRLLAPHLPETSVVILDDTNRTDEHDLAVEWSQAFGLRRERFRSRSDHAFDVLQRAT